MNKIYIVEAYFQNYESHYIVKIGLFTDRESAEMHKSKWESIFSQMEKENIENDEFFNSLNEFESIDIYELDLNTDIFLDNIGNLTNNTFKDIAKKYDRDWKLKNLLD